MVGVAGRSKGCNTCRKRKIACGLQRPQCTQCAKSNRLCTGYQREHVFIVNQEFSYGTRGTTSHVKPNYTPATSWTESLPERGPVNLKCLATGKRTKTPKAARPLSTIQPVPEYQQMLFDLFLRSYVPVDELGPSNGNNWWLGELATLPNQPQCLKTAILALSLSQVGKESNDEHLGKESLKHYTIGLRELQKALYDPEQMHTDETLATCFLLSMYELFECPDGDTRAYAQHNRACAKLIQLRGPKGYSKGLAHSLFLAIRPQCIFECLNRHESTFIADESWLTEPWANHAKAPMDRLLDYLAQAPGIFGTTDNFSAMCPLQILITTLTIIDRCWAMDAELQDFYLQLGNSIPGPLYWPQLSTISSFADDIDATKGKVFPVAFYFFNLKMAAILMLYWANLCMMYHGMALLYNKVVAAIPVDRKLIYDENGNPMTTSPSCAIDNADPKIMKQLRKGIPPCPRDCPCKLSPFSSEASSPSNSNFSSSFSSSTNAPIPCLAFFNITTLQPLSHRTDFLTPARNVCQSVEYCLQPKMLDMGPNSVATPLAIVLDTIKGHVGDVAVGGVMGGTEGRDVYRVLEWGREIMRGMEERLPFLRWCRK